MASLSFSSILPSNFIPEEGKEEIPSSTSSTSSSSSSTIIASPTPPITSSVEEARSSIINFALAAMKTITADNERRLADFVRDPTLLTSGIFYPNTYFYALQTARKTQELELLKNNGAFYHGCAPEDFFTMKPNKASVTKLEVLGYALKPGIQPIEGLKALEKGLTFLGCGETCVLVYLKALIIFFGKEKFNAFFANEGPMPLNLSQKIFNPFIEALLIRATRQERGDISYFKNVDNYTIKHINGEGAGFFTLFVDQYFGLGIPSAGVDEAGVSELLRSEYNAAPIGNAIFSRKVAKQFTSMYKSAIKSAMRLEKDQLSKKDFTKLGGGTLLPSFIRLNFERLIALKTAPIDKGCELLRDWIAPSSSLSDMDEKLRMLHSSV